MSDTSRNHHYVPQFYLRGFLNPGCPKKQLHVIDKTERRSFLTNPRNVGSKRDFNRAEIPGLPADDAEKRIFGLIDRAAGKALKYIADHEELPTDTKMPNLIYFVAVLAAHNPYIRDILINAAPELHKQRMKSLVSSREMYESEMQRVHPSGPKVPYEVAKQFVEEERYTIKITFPHGYHMGHELKAIQEVVFPRFSRMRWSLLIAEEGASNFVCSDRPVVLFNIIDPPYLRQSSNTLTEPTVTDTELTMPLNLRMALNATFKDPSAIAIIDERTVAGINERTILAAERQIYCPHLDFKFLDGEEMKSGRDLVSV